MDSGAGFAAPDDQGGIDQLLADWRMDKHARARESCLACFERSLHVRNCAKRILDLFNSATPEG